MRKGEMVTKMLRSCVVSKEKEEEEEKEEKWGSNSNPRPLYLLRQGRVNRKRHRSGQIAKGNGRSHACRQTRPASPWGPVGSGEGYVTGMCAEVGGRGNPRCL